jgi:hypothetical protein
MWLWCRKNSSGGRQNGLFILSGIPVCREQTIWFLALNLVLDVILETTDESINKEIPKKVVAVSFHHGHPGFIIVDVVIYCCCFVSDVIAIP